MSFQARLPLRVAVLLLAFVAALPVWPPKSDGLIVDMATPASSVERGVRGVAVTSGHTNLLASLTGWQPSLRDPISAEDRQRDSKGHAIATVLASRTIGVVPGAAAVGVDWELLAPRPDADDVTGLSSTGAAFAEWVLVMAGRCLNEPVVFSIVLLGEDLDVVGSVDKKADVVAAAGMSTLVVSSAQLFDGDVPVDVVRVGTTVELASWVLDHSSSC